MAEQFWFVCGACAEQVRFSTKRGAYVHLSRRTDHPVGAVESRRRGLRVVEDAGNTHPREPTKRSAQ